MRLSGLQKDVISLYRQCLRECRKKPQATREHFKAFARYIVEELVNVNGADANVDSEPNSKRTSSLINGILAPSSFCCAKASGSSRFTRLQGSRTSNDDCICSFLPEQPSMRPSTRPWTSHPSHLLAVASCNRRQRLDRHVRWIRSSHHHSLQFQLSTCLALLPGNPFFGWMDDVCNQLSLERKPAPSAQNQNW